MFNTLTGQLRVAGFVEGVSYLLLLGVAMPLKYVWDMPEYVRVVGMTHGLLFILYCVLLAAAMRKHAWSFGFGAYLFVATLIPFGTFFSDRRLRDLETTPAS